MQYNAPTSAPSQQIGRNRAFHCKMRNKLYEQSFYLFRKIEGLAQDGSQFDEHDIAPLLRKFAEVLLNCLEHADAAVFYGKRGKLATFSKDRHFGILQEEYILVHFLKELRSSVLYILNRIDTDDSLQNFAQKLKELTGDDENAQLIGEVSQGFAGRVLESLSALKETDASEFKKIFGVLAKRYEIGNKLFSLLQDLQHFR